MHFILDKILKRSTYYTPFYRSSFQSCDLKNRFFWFTLYNSHTCLPHPLLPFSSPSLHFPKSSHILPFWGRESRPISWH